MVPIRAVYKNGQLQLLDPVDLIEGQEVQLQILSDRDRLLEAVSDMLVRSDVDQLEKTDLDEAALQQFIDDHAQGVTLSDMIIEERRTGR